MNFQKDKYLPIDLREKQKLIILIKDGFQKKLGRKLGLIRVSAPVFLDKNSGLSDDLTGVERKVEFDARALPGKEFQVSQSLAKWKRYALAKYSFGLHEGLYTDMVALRRDEEVDDIHSVFVDQYDWEKVISAEDRTERYLKKTVIKIAEAAAELSESVRKKCGIPLPRLKREVFFITSQQLCDMYPNFTPKRREYEIVKRHKTVFIMQIGGVLSDGTRHDFRAPDYDDWTLNGDLLMWHEVTDTALEISSMGIRADGETLRRQCIAAGKSERLALPYHRSVLDNKLPLTIGGGIGQSRLCMLILGRAYIGEVQSCYWPDSLVREAFGRGIEFL